MFTPRPLLALFVALGLLATSCGGGTTEVEAVDSGATADAPAESAEPAPADAASASLVASTIDGGQIDFASLEGEDVVLWFWAPW